jgi:hypothetical protein
LTGARARPSPWLMRRIPEVVAGPRWCGGLTRADLAEALRVREWDRVFVASLLACYRQHKIDFCRDYVVKPVTGRS